MKGFNILKFVVVFAIVGFQLSDALAQTGVSINSTGTAPDADAVLDITSADKGVLLPRVADHTTLTPDNNADYGLVVFNTTTKTYWYWDGLAWQEIPNMGSIGTTLDDAYDGGGSGAGRIITADAGNVEVQGAGFLTVASNVGIGTTTPDRRMKISGTGWTALEVENTDAQAAALELTSQGVSNYVYTDVTGFLGLESAANEDIVLRTDGGTERMRVQNTSGDVRVINLADAASAVVLSDPQGDLTKTSLTGSATDVFLGTGVFGDASTLDDVDWFESGTTAAPDAIGDNIYTQGTVAIGANITASSPLQVQASGSGNPNTNSILANNPTNSAGNDAIVAARVAGTSAGDPFFSMDVVGEAGWSVGMDNSHGNRFKIAPSWNNLSFNTAMTIKADGNVGVNTDDPDQKLQVNGVVRSEGSYVVDVDGANGAGPRIAWGTAANPYSMMNLGAYSSINNLETTTRDFRIGSTNAFNAIYVKASDGYIGLGTATPGYPLNVTRTKTGDWQARFTNGASNVYLANQGGYGMHINTGGTNSAGRYALEVRNASQVHMYVREDGNVGIGSSAPAQKLHVVGTARVSALAGTGNRMVYANANGDLGASSPAINTGAMIDGAGAATRVAYWSDANTLTSNGQFYYAGENLYVANPEASTATVRLGAAWNRPGVYSSQELQLFSDATGIIFGDSNVERMRMTAAGNLGVGTTGPSRKLHVAGNIYAATTVEAAANGTWYMRGGDDHELRDVNVANTMGLWGRQNSDRGGIQLGSDGSYIFGDNGNIGVGTTGPSQKLDVAGAVRSTGHHYINNTSPTIYLQDTDHETGMIHMNSHLMYFLSGTGNNSTTWATNGTRWPLTINMQNDDFTFGGRALFMEGNVGIGTTNPTYHLHVAGRVKTTGINETSDARMKKNISQIDNALDKVLKMNGVTYNWRVDEFPQENLTDDLQHGLIAQELETIIPELVLTDEEGWKSIEYTHLVPVLIEALKEQQEIIQSQNQDIQDLKLKADASASQIEAILERLDGYTNK